MLRGDTLKHGVDELYLRTLGRPEFHACGNDVSIGALSVQQDSSTNDDRGPCQLSNMRSKATCIQSRSSKRLESELRLTTIQSKDLVPVR